MSKAIFFLVIALFISVNAPNVNAQQKVYGNVNVADETWEYLVVNVNELTNENNTSETKQEIPDLQPTASKINNKNFGYIKDGLTYYATTYGFIRVQAVLDYLGKSSWELAGIIPPEIGGGNTLGKARLIFKRRFNNNRSIQEAEERRKQEERQKQIDELQAKSKSTSQNRTDVKKAELAKVEIVDLDALEFQQKNEALQLGQVQKIRQALENIKTVKLVIEKMNSGSVPNRYTSISGVIKIDGTLELLKDGKYRASEAKKFLRDKAVEIAAQMGLQIYGEPFDDSGNGNTNIDISLVVTYRGGSKVVASERLSGFYSDKPPSK